MMQLNSTSHATGTCGEPRTVSKAHSRRVLVNDRLQLRKGWRRTLGSCVESFKPCTDGDAERFDHHSGKNLGISIQTPQSRAQQGNGPRAIVSLKMVKR